MSGPARQPEPPPPRAPHPLHTPSAPQTLPALSVIAPAHNEQENVSALVDEMDRALTPTGVPFEFILVDDGSTDNTRAVIQSLMPARPWLRCVAMQNTPQGKGHGQSAAFCAGFRVARGGLIATLDADLQNDPADFPRLLQILRETGADMVQGDRSRARKDNWVRRRTSAIGRFFRRVILNDRIRDTGCSLRIMKAEIARNLPMDFKGMHRFIPALANQMGFKVVETPVNHRPRTAGTTKYGLGIWQRALPGLMDCFSVRWMGKRRRPTMAHEVSSATAAAAHPRDASQTATFANDADLAVEVVASGAPRTPAASPTTPATPRIGAAS